ncbi:MAG: biotin-dependent carboxyltransferase family protein [Nocardioidaceae bacterium]
MTLRVTRADGLVTVQDRGRVGWAHVGVPRAGALDAPAADLANRLVGNLADAAVLETTLLGVGFVTDRALTFAVTGAPCEVVADGRSRPHGEPVTVAAGTLVEVGAARAGVRSYVAVAGGLDVAPVMGSRSTDTLALLGPPPVVAGTELPVAPSSGGPRPVDVSGPRPTTGPLTVSRGPRADWFTPDAWRLLTDAAWVVTPDSNRIGLRLDGARLARARVGELPSEGLVAGAVQVPPDGRPVVLLADHPTTGGYPVVAVVAAADLARCAQLRPGDVVRFSARPPAAG